jgi:hypothetical protein
MAISMEPPAMNPLVLVVIPSLGLHFRMERERPLRHRAKLQLSAAHAYGESFVQMRGSAPRYVISSAQQYARAMPKR